MLNKDLEKRKASQSRDDDNENVLRDVKSSILIFFSFLPLDNRDGIFEIENWKTNFFH